MPKFINKKSFKFTLYVEAISFLKKKKYYRIIKYFSPALHSPFFSVSVDVEDKVEALDYDKHNNDKDKNKKSYMDENVHIVCV